MPVKFFRAVETSGIRMAIANPNSWTLEKLALQLGVKIADLMLYHGSKSKDIYNVVCPPTTSGQKIRNLRLRYHIQQNALAKMLGINKVTLCQYEKNIVRPPEKLILKIETLFNNSSIKV